MDRLLATGIDLTTSTLVLALVSLGLAVVFGLVRVINMGHGAMLALGAYLAWSLTGAGWPFPLAVAGAAVGVAAVGFVFEYLVIRHFYGRLFDTLLISWGFYLVVTELIKVVWGSTLKSVPNPLPGSIAIGGAGIGRYEAVVCVISVLLLTAAGAVLYRTDVGLRVRAMIGNREMAQMLGVDAPRLYRGVFVAGSALAGLAGALIAPLFSIEPDLGTLWLVRAFFVVTVGGLGAIVGGTVVGSALIAGGTVVFSVFSPQVFAQTVVFALAVIALRARPTGLIGRTAVRA
ncbi:branched-chain amino acid ABC transporter permease [Cryptosporangium japonicum]|uniref:Branched-chain amino acid ABC transporter permease n=1 Tax=Cryptosporangium japonicum TaxID=80872 RepID=A0ABP3DN93_9ACTN